MHRVLPSPSKSAVHLSFLTIHFYAIAILSGIIVAILLTRGRLRKIGENPDLVLEVSLWVIPAGIIGGRVYHLITSPENYFGDHGVPSNAFKIWEGGLGIWGAVAAGAGVAYWRLFKLGRAEFFSRFADALAPGLLIAQAIGRWGNWFNIELFGKPLSPKVPWALNVPESMRPIGFENYSTFHPTFLYESLWCFFGSLLMLALAKKVALPSGAIFLLYIDFYCLGRFWIEGLRIDSAHHLGGLRLNQWVSLVCFIFSSVAIARLQRRKASTR